MQLTDAEIAAIVGVLVVLANALAVYLNHLSTTKQIKVLHTKVDRMSHAPPAVPHG